MASPAVATFLESTDPANGEVIARFEITAPGSLPGVIARAQRAQRDWCERALRDRCLLLGRLRDVLYRRRREIAEVVTREVGKPLVESLFADVLISLDTAAYYAQVSRVAKLLRPERVPHRNLALKAKRGVMLLEPYGIIAIISPWNYPVAIPLGQIIPAVVAGNAVVLKPSEFTPWCGALVGEVFAQAGFPQDVVQVVQGGGELGGALVGADGVGKVVFTGSVATGRRVAETCARRLIPSVLELGGKDAMIVLDDADLDVASSGAVWGSFTNCGQACLSVERLYVARSVAERFTELCVVKTKKLRVGAGLDPASDIGPMISPQQVERVERLLADAVARGARILTGGRRMNLGPCFFEPTVITGVDSSMLLMREETFGPVLAICPVTAADEAVRRANDSPFGLAASVWTRDTRRGEQIAARLNAGAVTVNDVLTSFAACEAPHGGRGASGWGRTHSRLGLLEMVQVKYVDVDRLARIPKSWWYAYSAELADAADDFLRFLFAPGLAERWRRARGVLRAQFRRNRV
jgi:succinate-semialdehyde dehydrogenase/glutarate-semialdehyde dehydrogenase